MTKTIAFAIIALLVLWLINLAVNVYNRLVMLKNNTSKSFANIDVLLKQRADEIPNLIMVVKESMKYEKNVLESLTDMRTRFMNTQNVEEKVQVSNEIEKTMKMVMAISENYPNLKASQSFLDLQSRVSSLEDAIADRREFYNESVNMYNIGIAEFPNVLMAKPMGYSKMSMLHISEQEKQYNGVQF